MLDMVVHRHAMRENLIRVLELLGNRPPSAAVTRLPQPDLEIPALTGSRQKGHSGEPGGAA